MTDRDRGNYVEAALGEAEKAFSVGWAGLRNEHADWWCDELQKSSISIPDERLQKLCDISLYYLLINVGGSYWGFCGLDNVIYEMCTMDNINALSALVETNHLEAAEQELILLSRCLPAARRNAAERLKCVLELESSEAAILPFYMTEDGIAGWRFFGMYTTMQGFHVLALLKTGRHGDDEGFLRKCAYPWLKAYAEYGRLNAKWDEQLCAYVYPIENVGGGSEGYWTRLVMNYDIYARVFAKPAPLKTGHRECTLEAGSGLGVSVDSPGEVVVTPV